VHWLFDYILVNCIFIIDWCVELPNLKRKNHWLVLYSTVLRFVFVRIIFRIVFLSLSLSLLSYCIAHINIQHCVWIWIGSGIAALLHCIATLSDRRLPVRYRRKIIIWTQHNTIQYNTIRKLQLNCTYCTCTYTQSHPQRLISPNNPWLFQT